MISGVGSPDAWQVKYAVSPNDMCESVGSSVNSGCSEIKSQKYIPGISKTNLMLDFVFVTYGS